ncbi:MAG: hypothetical protein G3M70_11925 [Candidatus Nitronauta litoralis]|uniref:Uncharacterized protein n=1 Tax=Candidatus Nitronauta litoralis TaxID=2705533 RepID=A0A7T0G0L8_9BACT|nr:MAG: hypothetical protein G3M70_11925 [Candidatus Nitronauta litoralis]
MMTLHRQIKNESGVATLLMVIAGILIVGLVGMNFVIEQQNKHQGSAVTVNAEQAQANAEAGFRYATKCLQGNDPQCRCNTDVGANGCQSWINMQNFAPINLGRGNFQVSFSNLEQCSIGITSTGTVNNTQRTVSDILTRNAIGGAVQAVIVTNSQSVLGPTIPPIAVLNYQSNDNSTRTNTITFPNYTTPVGSNLVLVVSAGGEERHNAQSVPSGITFAGQPMTLAASGFSSGGGEDPGVGMFYLPVASGVTGDVVATFNDTTDTQMIGIATLSNAISPPEAVVFFNDDDDPVSQIRTDITTQTTNAMIMSAAHYKDDNNLQAIGTDHVELSGNDNPSNSSEGAMGYLPATTATTYTNIGYQRQGGSNDEMALVLAAFGHANRTISMNYTVPAGGNQILVVVAGAEDGVLPRSPDSTLPISATFNGTPMNLVTNENITAGGSFGFQAGLGMFWLAVNAGDSGTITVTYTDSAIDDKTLHAYTLNNAVGPPERFVVNSSTVSPNITQDFANILTAGAMIATGGYEGTRTGIGPLPLAGTHVIHNQVLAASSSGVMGSRPVPVAQTPLGIGWTGNFNRMALILASFPPAGGGGLCTDSP